MTQNLQPCLRAESQANDEACRYDADSQQYKTEYNPVNSFFSVLFNLFRSVHLELQGKLVIFQFFQKIMEHGWKILY